MPRFISALEASKIDQLLMEGKYRFSLIQLMELAGLSVAAATRHFINNSLKKEQASILALVGPGNNGGDALVAARHLKMFGHNCHIWIPKEPSKQLFKDLTVQCENIDIQTIIGDHNSISIHDLKNFDLVLDGFFGFSFTGEIREPYLSIIRKIKNSQIPIFSIDIPSGWHVDEGNINNEGFEPQALISLTAPKSSAKFFKGTHYLGGRFVPPSIEEEFKLDLPKYEKDKMYILL